MEEALNYQCDNCDLKFPNEKKYFKHAKVHHGKIIKPFGCEKCDLMFRTEKLLELHCTKNHAQNESVKPYQCRHCDKSFALVDALEKHVNATHLIYKPYQCDICNDIFTYRIEMMKHKAKMHEKKEKSHYQCKKCNLKFTTKLTFFKHLKSVHRPKKRAQVPKSPQIPKIPQIPSSSSASETRNLVDVSKINENFCKICTIYFKSKLLFNNHLQSFHKHHCELCKNYFSLERDLKEHMSHDHKNCLECPECGVKCRGKLQLTVHTKTEHGNQNPFPCSLCNRSFISSVGLHYHMNFVHKLPLSCIKCKLKFSNIMQLKSHNETVHQRLKKSNEMNPDSDCSTDTADEQEFCSCEKKNNLKNVKIRDYFDDQLECRLCPQKLDTEEDCKVHVTMIHMYSYSSERPFMCEICENSFTSIEEIKDHIHHLHLKPEAQICKKCDLFIRKEAK